MKTANLFRTNPVRTGFALLSLSLLAATGVQAQDAAPATNGATVAVAHAPLPPIPLPLSVPRAGPTNDGPYMPQAIVQGGVVVTLYPPDSPKLHQARLHEAEKYSMTRNDPGRVANVVNVHNPSIEVHTVDPTLNTGVAVIVAPGGGHTTLVIGSEGADFVPWFYNYGINTIILRYRLRADGYQPQVDAVSDALQAIRMVRAHAKEWGIDPNKIGFMGFSAGAELAAPAAIQFADFDAKNNDPSDPLAGITSRPDFVGIIYPGPSPFRNGAAPPIPRNTPPAFITCAGWGDAQHATWANEYFTAMLAAGVPNVEMHIYARGHHPGDRVGPDEPASTGGLTDRGFIEYGTWPMRFIDWSRDLGFLQKPGIETQAAKDVAAHVSAPPRRGGGGGRGGRGRGGAGGTNAPAATAAPAVGAPATEAPRGTP